MKLQHTICVVLKRWFSYLRETSLKVRDWEHFHKFGEMQFYRFWVSEKLLKRYIQFINGNKKQNFLYNKYELSKIVCDFLLAWPISRIHITDKLFLYLLNSKWSNPLLASEICLNLHRESIPKIKDSLERALADEHTKSMESDMNA